MPSLEQLPRGARAPTSGSTSSTYSAAPSTSPAIVERVHRLKLPALWLQEAWSTRSPPSAPGRRASSRSWTAACSGTRRAALAVRYRSAGGPCRGTQRDSCRAQRPICAILRTDAHRLSRRCTGSATTSWCSMRPADIAARARSGCARLADRRTGIGFDQALRARGAARAARHGGVLPDLQRRRRRGRAVRQRRALYRRAAASPRR